MSGPKILVAVADFGGRNTLPTVLECFNHPNFQTVVFSTVDGEYIYPPSIGEDLPFMHREIFAEEVENYDYFFFTENDIYYPETALKVMFQNFDVFGLQNPIGFIRYEEEQLIDFGAVLQGSKIAMRDRERMMFVPTNQHQASYVLSRHQLHLAIDSKNYLIQPSARGGYGKLETGASNVYFECGLQKSYHDRNLQNLLVRHMDLKWKYLQPRYTLDNLNRDLK